MEAADALDLSIVIPAWNRVQPLHLSLQSVALALAAAPSLRSEVLVVDDGSTPALAPLLAAHAGTLPLQVLRQANAGSIQARLHGLRVACGAWVLFLDSDDLLTPQRFAEPMLAAMREADAEVLYGDMALASARSEGGFDYTAQAPMPATRDLAELFLTLQPAPHVPMYRRRWLQAAVADPLVPPQRRFDAAGDVWLYYTLCTTPGIARHVQLPVAAVGPHEESRYSQCWERLGLAALGIAESFLQRCPPGPATHDARQRVGECALHTYRRLPRDMHPRYVQRTLALWRACPRPPLQRLGGPLFVALARCIGPLNAARVLRLRNRRHADIGTMDPAQLAQALQD